MAFDYGQRHIGVAVGETITGSARALEPLTARSGRPAVAALKSLLERYGPDQLIVGLPLNMDGTESSLSGEARDFGRWLARRARLPVAYCDERLTTREAAETHRGRDQHGQAAVLIAESYLREANRPQGPATP